MTLGSSKFEVFVGTIPNDVNAKSNLLLHPYDSTAIVSDDRHITVFDSERLSRTQTFCNNNPIGSQISTLLFLNDEDASLLLAGSGIHNYNHRRGNCSNIPKL